MAQEQVNKTSSKTEEDEAPVEAKDLSNEELSDAVDDILADIDDVLEENAEEFVASFIQKGGE